MGSPPPRPSKWLESTTWIVNANTAETRDVNSAILVRDWEKADLTIFRGEAALERCASSVLIQMIREI